MLWIDRRPHERFTLQLPTAPAELLALAGTSITVLIQGIRGDDHKVDLGIEAPKSIHIVRDDAKKDKPRGESSNH